MGSSIGEFLEQTLDYRTLNRFRLRVKNQLQQLFTQIVLLRIELGLVDVKNLADELCTCIIPLLMAAMDNGKIPAQ